MNNVFKDDLVFSSILHGACLRLFGAEYINWEPEVVEEELNSLYTGIPSINFDKIQAVCALVSSENFYKYYEAFEKISKVLNMEVPLFGRATPLKASDMFWALLEAKLVDEDEFNRENPFSEEVYEYMYQICKKDGVIRVPPFCNKTVNLPRLNKKFNKFGVYALEQKKEQISYEADTTSMFSTRLTMLRNQASLLKNLP